MRRRYMPSPAGAPPRGATAGVDRAVAYGLAASVLGAAVEHGRGARPHTPASFERRC